ncbi:MAG: VCBS repeat-containing protein [Oscillospiraceae bacterium]|jgi:hypothetical protein|nr:VCBS repeat-containing protein [Oscillospiraceae bacterium]
MTKARITTRIAAATTAIAALLLISSCMLSSADELFELPRVPNGLLNLQYQLAQVTDRGAQYSPPQSGVNRQSLQLVDLAGDGNTAAVAFFSTLQPSPLKVYVYRADADGAYQIASVIDAAGDSFDQVYYADLDGDGILEIIVGQRLSETLRCYSVYSSGDDLRYSLAASGDYTAMTVAELPDYRSSLFSVLIDSRGGGGTAEAMLMGAGKTIERHTDRLTGGVTEIRQLVLGLLSDGAVAAYVDSLADGEYIVTDVFTASGDGLVNVALLSGGENPTRRSARYTDVYSADRTTVRDGVIDVPVDIYPQGRADAPAGYIIDRYDFDSRGNMTFACNTYRDIYDEWYIVMPPSFREQYSVRAGANPAVLGETVTAFTATENGESVIFLKVYELTGDNREERAALPGRFVLYDSLQIIIAAEIVPGDASRELDESYIIENFGRILPIWNNELE